MTERITRRSLKVEGRERIRGFPTWIRSFCVTEEVDDVVAVEGVLAELPVLIGTSNVALLGYELGAARLEFCHADAVANMREIDNVAQPYGRRALVAVRCDNLVAGVECHVVGRIFRRCETIGPVRGLRTLGDHECGRVCPRIGVCTRKLQRMSNMQEGGGSKTRYAQVPVTLNPSALSASRVQFEVLCLLVTGLAVTDEAPRRPRARMNCESIVAKPIE